MKKDILHFSYSLEGIGDAVKQFWGAAQGYHIIAFSGEMGAGKTTFIHELCNYLGVTDTVSSPTFALINEYHFEDKSGEDILIYHMDWYRLKDTAEAINSGMEDCLLQAQNRNTVYCFAEWPEKAPELLPPGCLRVNIQITTPKERSVSLATGA